MQLHCFATIITSLMFHSYKFYPGRFTIFPSEIWYIRGCCGTAYLQYRVLSGTARLREFH